MSDAADRLAQAIRDVIDEAVRAAVVQQCPTPPPAKVSEHPTTAEEDFDLCQWCNKRHMRHLMPVKEARHQLGGLSPTTFYALVKEGELSLVKIGRRSFVQAEGPRRRPAVGRRPHRNRGLLHAVTRAGR